MNDKLETRTQVAGMSAGELINSGLIVKTISNDWLICVGDSNLYLALTENYELVVSDYGIGIAIMDLTNAELSKMLKLSSQVEENYIKALTI